MLNKLKLNRREKKFVLTLLPFLLIGLLLPGRLSVTTSPSLDHRVFFLGGKPTADGITRGDYLLFKLDGERVIKIAACLPGDRLTSINGKFTCNGQLLGQALEANSLNEPLPRFHFNGLVPQGQLFLVGNHPRSYDSRYTGFINDQDIQHKAYPLW